MNIRDCRIEDIRISALARMQCIHGCQHYKRHMFCPPACPSEENMRRVYSSYQRVRICYERFEYTGGSEMRDRFNGLHQQLINQEIELRSDNRFAMAFSSAPCSGCDVNECKFTHCRRPHIGRMPICATGIDMGHLITDAIGLGKEDSVLFWKGKLSEQYIQKAIPEALFVGAVLY